MPAWLVIMAAMTSQKTSGRLVSDQLWELLELLIPPPQPAKNGRTGRPRVDDRAALNGILFVAENGNAKEEAARGAGLRLRDHLLAPATRLAGSRGVGEASPRRARTARARWGAGLVEGLPGLE